MLTAPELLADSMRDAWFAMLQCFARGTAMDEIAVNARVFIEALNKKPEEKHS